MTPCASIRPTAPGLALHGSAIALLVAATQRQSGDEMVQHELVQDDEAPPALERVDDPAVRVGVVPDVVERHIGASRRLPPTPPDDGDLHATLERGEQKSAVVSDTRSLGRKR